MSDLSNVRVDGQRLWDSLMEMAKIGGTPKGGCKRLTLTDVDKQGRELFRSWCQQAGLTLKIDEMGNMFARRAGVEDNLPPSCSAATSTPSRPAASSTACSACLARSKSCVRSTTSRSRRAIRSRSPTGPTRKARATRRRWCRRACSPASTPRNSPIRGSTRKARDSATNSSASASKGEEPVGGRPLHAYFELHIEQGPILEDEGYDVGVVTHGQGQRWYELKLTGFESHAGSTPMPARKDALLGAARIVELVNAIGLSKAPLGVSTCGMINAYPNSRNVIPARCSWLASSATRSTRR